MGTQLQGNARKFKYMVQRLAAHSPRRRGRSWLRLEPERPGGNGAACAVAPLGIWQHTCVCVFLVKACRWLESGLLQGQLAKEKRGRGIGMGSEIVFRVMSLGEGGGLGTEFC